MKNYDYRVDNRSLLAKPIINALVDPLIKITPAKLPANFISIASHVLVYLALFLSYQQVLPGNATFIAIPILLLLHVITDKLDGIQARATDTSSALGEFVDHFFNVFNAGAVIFIVYNLYQISHGWILTVAITILAFSLMAKYYEQYKANLLIIDKIGLLEAKILVIVIIFLSYYPPIYEWLNQPDVSSYTLMEGVLLLSTFFASISWVRTVVRISHLTYGFWLFATLLITVSVTAMLLFDPVFACVIILLYGGLYTGKLLMGQLVDGIERSPGLFTPVLMLLHIFFSSFFESLNIFFILFIYLTVNLLLVIMRTVRALKQDWYWRNP